jgi:threonine dehydrogenase-like Zn-dependent dehydrogenase
MYLDAHSLVHKVDAAVPAPIASMFNPLGAGVRWAHRMPGTGIGDTVVVLGCGQRGLTSVIAALEAGAKLVIVTGLTADIFKFEVARAFGAHITVNVETQDVVAAVRDATGGAMADVVIDVTSGATQPVSDALDLARAGGRIVLAGGKYGPVPEFDSRKVMAKELTIMGALAVDYESYEAAIRIIESGKYPLELMHTHTLPLADMERALRILGNEVDGERGIHLSIQPDL